MIKNCPTVNYIFALLLLLLFCLPGQAESQITYSLPQITGPYEPDSDTIITNLMENLFEGTEFTLKPIKTPVGKRMFAEWRKDLIDIILIPHFSIEKEHTFIYHNVPLFTLNYQFYALKSRAIPKINRNTYFDNLHIGLARVPLEWWESFIGQSLNNVSFFPPGIPMYKSLLTGRVDVIFDFQLSYELLRETMGFEDEIVAISNPTELKYILALRPTMDQSTIEKLSSILEQRLKAPVSEKELLNYGH